MYEVSTTPLVLEDLTSLPRVLKVYAVKIPKIMFIYVLIRLYRNNSVGGLVCKHDIYKISVKIKTSSSYKVIDGVA